MEWDNDFIVDNIPNADAGMGEAVNKCTDGCVNVNVEQEGGEWAALSDSGAYIEGLRARPVDTYSGRGVCVDALNAGEEFGVDTTEVKGMPEGFMIDAVEGFGQVNVGSIKWGAGADGFFLETAEGENGIDRATSGSEAKLEL